jgi:hypothetical protein
MTNRRKTDRRPPHAATQPPATDTQLTTAQRIQMVAGMLRSAGDPPVAGDIIIGVFTGNQAFIHKIEGAVTPESLYQEFTILNTTGPDRPEEALRLSAETMAAAIGQCAAEHSTSVLVLIAVEELAAGGRRLRTSVAVTVPRRQ